ncbi:TPA: transcriptional regulator [Providencia alcalifaciens]
MPKYITTYDFVSEYPFEKPLHRLIMCRVLAAGGSDGYGERIINNEAMAQFCCCSKQALFKETKVLERLGVLVVRKIASVTVDAKLKVEPVRGYTIITKSNP